ncbi:hypothetical protein MGMO_35c00240 [Methyloglobulus morosus KoM1]|uniref:Transmembrane protein n=1 Tax=Methyloglobulus morosus KoM1 TaxID=1116472 RepID=V5C8T6_9GAMM|nr:hypothetical protein [Methyloglobulus morosus]ESS73128.1 hypothetical protein MGMO_35c00240 [Methyloglobulus morosus KoM1]
MSASSVSIHDSLCDQKQAVSFRLLLGLYGIIPVCLILQCLDHWLWQDYLRNNLPSSPYHFVLFQILFGTPHIIASNILLVSNKDYLVHYRKHIALMTVAIVIGYVLGNMLLPYRLLYVFVAAWTVYHVLKQQYGIARGVCQLPESAFKLLLALSVAAGVAIYLSIFLRSSLTAEQVYWIKHIAALGCLLLVSAAFVCQHFVVTSFGLWFYWSNVFLVLASFYLFLQQHYFMAILVPRFVHDATAYVFYVTHDYNKHQHNPQNIIYRYAGRCGIHLFLVLPCLSFSLAFLLQAYGDYLANLITQYLLGTEFYKVVTLGFLGYLALMHYYMEGLTWQKDSPYRKFIAFSK